MSRAQVSKLVGASTEGPDSRVGEIAIVGEPLVAIDTREESLVVTGATPINQTLFPGVNGDQWFTNNGNFTNPAVGTFGTCPNQLGYLRTAHYTDVDLSLHKDFLLTERFKLQFRADFINAFNHVQLNAPYPWDLGSSLGQVTSAQPP